MVSYIPRTLVYSEGSKRNSSFPKTVSTRLYLRSWIVRMSLNLEIYVSRQNPESVDLGRRYEYRSNLPEYPVYG